MAPRLLHYHVHIPFIQPVFNNGLIPEWPIAINAQNVEYHFEEEDVKNGNHVVEEGLDVNVKPGIKEEKRNLNHASVRERVNINSFD